MMARTLAVIPARAGSRRIPNKNIADFGGRTLIEWTIEAALGSACLGNVVVCTDSPEVALIARTHDCAVIRPERHNFDQGEASDAVLSVLMTLPDSIRWPHIVAMLLPTSPLRDASHIDEAMALFESRPPGVDVVISGIGRGTSIRKLRAVHYGLLEPLHCTHLFESNGAIQITTAGHLMAHGTFHAGGVQPYYMRPDDGIDIDTYEDLARARGFLQERGSLV